MRFELSLHCPGRLYAELLRAYTFYYLRLKAAFDSLLLYSKVQVLILYIQYIPPTMKTLSHLSYAFGPE